MSFTSSNRLSDFKLIFSHAAEKGVLLLIACALAILLANSSFKPYYFEFIEKTFLMGSTSFTLTHIVNDFLMALFFLMVGLEIKREMIEGHLSTTQQKILPFIAAIGGVLCPMAIYYLYNTHDTSAIRGWAIPAATDIAFALGMLSLLGKGLPTSLRVFLTALAIIDDLIAVVVIAIFYSDHLAIEYLMYIGITIVTLLLLCKYGFQNLYAYLLIGLLLWVFFLKSGIHATVAGVTLGMFIPLKTKNPKVSPLKQLEKTLSPVTLYFILPLFAFVNSGVDLSHFNYDNLFNNVSMGIIAGLFFGKQIGIFFSSFILIKTKLISIPSGSNYLQFYGVSVLCGIGFTMSLFVANLAFLENPDFLNQAKAGILLGSLFSAIYGGLIIKLTKRKRQNVY